jgi:uncharacterized protein
MWEWDEAKRQANLAKHGVDFAVVVNFDWTTADVRVDDRFDYGEVRKFALGLIDGRLFALVYAERNGLMRVITRRKANEREKRLWSTSSR